MRTRRSLTFTLMALLLLGATPALADNDAGCGLGTMLWEGKSGTVFKLFASTTNGWLGTQTVGITLGTSGCSQGGVVTAEHRLEMFLGSNVDQVARDMAVGEGETLDAIATILEIAPADRASFNALSQASFGEIFAENATSGDMAVALQQVMARDRLLASYAGS